MTYYHRIRLSRILLCILSVLCITGCGARVNTVDFYENLDKRVLTVDGEDYPLRYMSLYIAYQESVVQEDALMYDPDNPMKYWNIHTNGEFIRVRARDEAMDSAIHDIIFLNMANADEVELSEEERKFALSTFGDFWDDLSDEQREMMAGIYDDMKNGAIEMALAQKYQVIYAAMEDADIEDYDKDGQAYLDMLEVHDIKIDEYLWKGLGFGTITLIY
ncbi:MAG: hypothetical protein K5929_05425 [Lachnospiraceae bacterium]|nr:hypothetical protein [Lachnospiraceae bacterium]